MAISLAIEQSCTVKERGIRVSKQYLQGASALSSSSSVRALKIRAKAHQDSINEEESDDQQYELRVCTNRTCRKSGSLHTLELLRGLASPNVYVESCGCLGRCGSGPNLVVLPAGIFVSHCNTGAHAAQLLALQCGLTNPDNNLKALAIKQQGNAAFESGDFAEAVKLFSEANPLVFLGLLNLKAIELQPSGGLHFLYANRSAALLGTGDPHGALDDATYAAGLAPKWHVPLLRQGEAYMALSNYHSAECAYKQALFIDPSLRRSKSYQKKMRELESMLAPMNTSA